MIRSTMRLRSIRWRLLSGIAAVQLLTGVAATLLVFHYEHQRSYAILESQIAQHAAMVKSVIEPSEDASSSAILHRELLTLPKHDFYVLNDESGKTIAASGEWRPSGPAGTDPLSFVTMDVGGRPYRVLIEQGIAMLDDNPEERAKLPKMILFYGARIGGAEEHIEQAAWTTAGLALLIMLISLAAVAWVVRSGLLPVTELAARAAKINALNWEWNVGESSKETEELAPLENALTRLIERLQSAFMRERQFSADAAHEMKTAVAIVKSTLQLTLERDGDSAGYRTGVESALEDTNRMQGLVDGMLQLAKSEGLKGGAPGAASVADVMEQIGTVVQNLAPLLEERRIGVEVKAAEGTVMVRIAAQDLRLVLMNLLENAIHHSAEGTTIELKVEAPAAMCVLSIRDEGCGIEVDMLPHIFDRFYRGDLSRSRESGGAGLGLSIVQAIVRGAGGSVTVTSTPGVGSAFTVLLPKGN